MKSSGGKCAANAGTLRASSHSQMSRTQVTASRGSTGRRAASRACKETAGTTSAGCAPRQTSTGTTANFKSPPEAATCGGVCCGAVSELAQQSAAGAAQQCPHFTSVAFVRQFSTGNAGPTARPSKSVKAKSRRTNIGDHYSPAQRPVNGSPHEIPRYDNSRLTGEFHGMVRFLVHSPDRRRAENSFTFLSL